MTYDNPFKTIADLPLATSNVKQDILSLRPDAADPEHRVLWERIHKNGHDILAMHYGMDPAIAAASIINAAYMLRTLYPVRHQYKYFLQFIIDVVFANPMYECKAGPDFSNPLAEPDPTSGLEIIFDEHNGTPSAPTPISSRRNAVNPEPLSYGEFKRLLGVKDRGIEPKLGTKGNGDISASLELLALLDAIISTLAEKHKDDKPFTPDPAKSK